MIKIYLAGPDVFSPDAIKIGKELKNLISKYSNGKFIGLYPMDNEINFTLNKYSNGELIYEANIKLIKECDIVLANLIPFRGPSADVGTVWECAFAKGLGKKVFGYNVSEKSKYKNKVIGKIPHDGMNVEDFDVFDNIMLAHSLDKYFSSFENALLFLTNLF